MRDVPRLFLLQEAEFDDHDDDGADFIDDGADADI